MAAVSMMIVVFMLIIGGLIYLTVSALICVGISKNKKNRLLYFSLFLSLPLLVATLNYYGFCFKKICFLNEQDIYAILDNSKYKKQSNKCYGAYIFSSKNTYGNFEKDIDGLYLYDGGGLIRILGMSYARIQISKLDRSYIMTNCGNIYRSEF